MLFRSEIANLQIAALEVRLRSKGFGLEVTREARSLIAVKGFDPEFGARPLKRIIQNELLDEIAIMMIDGNLKKGSKIHLDAKNDALKFSITAPDDEELFSVA